MSYLRTRVFDIKYPASVAFGNKYDILSKTITNAPAMLKNFSEAYKKILLKAEIHTKEHAYTFLEEQDIIHEIMHGKHNPIYDLFVSYGINEKVYNDTMLQPQFTLSDRQGTYSGISSTLNETIISSVKIAAEYGKDQAGVTDFLLALLRKKS